MKEVSGGGTTRNVLHFQWLLKVQRKKGFLLEILVNRAKEICNRVNIMQFGITAYCHLGEAKKSQKDVLASRLHFNIFRAQNRKRGKTRKALQKKAESIVKKSRQGRGMGWSFSAHTCQPFPAHLLGWLVVLVMYANLKFFSWKMLFFCRGRGQL